MTAADGFYVVAGHNPGVHGAVFTDALAWLGWPEWAADRWPSLANDNATQAWRRHRPADEETDPPDTGK